MNDPAMLLGVRRKFAKSILVIRTLVNDDSTGLFSWKRGSYNIVDFIRYDKEIPDQKSYWTRARDDLYTARSREAFFAPRHGA